QQDHECPAADEELTRVRKPESPRTGSTSLSAISAPPQKHYDAAGHTTSYSRVTIGYNDRGRASVITNAQAGTITITPIYNALGQLINSGSAPGTIIGLYPLYWYDEAGH